ncbi:hypothetical protein JCGZ_07211 [Jatropha curcas]|uniref:Uncharacterized protein n=1 Tax=Jatropha curcas TaxID=180498 RepID=A0A067KMY7_JATCU|nr:hypothetical protein JCGZ_07211 [Jatropha curcas]
MGVRLTTIKNKSCVEMELRVFAAPARPDHFQKIIRIRPGGKVNVSFRSICEEGRSSGRLVIIMVYVEGGYSGVSLLPSYLASCSEVICDRDEDGILNVQGIKATMFDTFLTKLLFSSYLPKNSLSQMASRFNGGDSFQNHLSQMHKLEAICESITMQI